MSSKMLPRISSPADLKALRDEELVQLAREMREELIGVVGLRAVAVQRFCRQQQRGCQSPARGIAVRFAIRAGPPGQFSPRRALSLSGF